MNERSQLPQTPCCRSAAAAGSPPTVSHSKTILKLIHSMEGLEGADERQSDDRSNKATGSSIRHVEEQYVPHNTAGPLQRSQAAPL